MEKVKVEGSKKNKNVFLYTLSTCGWCKKTKEYLKENNVEYEYIDVDKCTRDEQKEILKDLKERKVPAAFPIIIIDDKIVISGFKQKDLQEALSL
jgi:glutaredoxin